MHEHIDIDELASTVSDYMTALLKRGADPYLTLQLTLGLQSTLLSKAFETYAAPGWPIKDHNNGTENNSRNNGNT
jgi:hypothetical protein